jgi:2-dehydro-3-deoxyphosphogluconate aldolase/(4S)-4-hydroxy-2-oxoglutarate aldolase
VPPGKGQRSVLDDVLEIGVVPVVRLDDLTTAVELAQALAAGGVPTVEYTLTNPGAIEAIRAVRAEVPEVIAGAGTVLDSESARLAILAGAQYLVTPSVCPDVIMLGLRYGVPTFCGAMTPTEILAAWQLGSGCIKVFPASVLGPAYFKAVRDPLPQVRLMPSGGVTSANAGAFIRAGAVAVSAGGRLIDPEAIAQDDWRAITAQAEAFRRAVREARGELSMPAVGAERGLP